jgi:hypothetical protein
MEKGCQLRKQGIRKGRKYRYKIWKERGESERAGRPSRNKENIFIA